MGLGLRGKVALVTGESEGIGYATAMRLATEGACVAMAARRAAVLEGAAQRIRETCGTAVLAVPTDVQQPEDVRRFGRIDALVNNAGRSFARYFLDVSDEGWQADLDLKFKAAVPAPRSTSTAACPGRSEPRLAIQSGREQRAEVNDGCHSAQALVTPGIR